jgi:hypothetical protein
MPRRPDCVVFLLGVLGVLVVLTLLPVSSARGGGRTLVRVDPNRTLFPDSSLWDVRDSLPAPAGKRGFLTVGSDGHFYWEDGSRARFWGVNIASRALRQSHDEIDLVARVLARAGVNMVRLEAIDNAGCLIAAGPTSRAFDPEYFDRVHYWIYALKRQGIALYLDLLDFRTFTEGDGVANAAALGRAAKPYAIFDRRLVELQQEYARRLLTTRNPYTRLAPVRDPAVALVELVNEHGMFLGQGWGTLASPYREQLQAQWNAWLRERYGTADRLRAAWARPETGLSATGRRGDGATGRRDVLNADEDPGRGTVALPAMERFGDEAARAEARLADGARFAESVQRAYFREMKAFLREIGLRVPITAAVSSTLAPDVKSVADVLDFTAENFYWDHPVFAPGRAWQAPSYHHDRSPLRSSGASSLVPYTGVLRWRGKPVVLREWNTTWPNRYRAAGVPEVAAYTALQDFDAVLCFTYDAAVSPDRLENFAVQADPTRWGLFAAGALLFHRRDVAPARDLLEVAYDDTALYTPGPFVSDLYRLGWRSRVRNVAAAAPSDTSVAVRLPAIRRQQQEKPLTPKTRKTRRREPLPPAPSPKRGGGAGALRHHEERPATCRYDGTRGTQAPLPVSGRGRGRGQPTTGSPWWEAYLNTPPLTDRTASDTGELVRDAGRGTLVIDTPRCQAVVGELAGSASGFQLGQLSVGTATTYGALIWQSLDGEPLSHARRTLLKMVSVARNTGQRLAPSDEPRFAGRLALLDPGGPPILTDGRPGPRPTVARGAGRDLVQAYMTDGVWELVRGPEGTLLFCDTPGVDFIVPGVQRARILTDNGPGDALDVRDGRLVYPAGAVALALSGTE